MDNPITRQEDPAKKISDVLFHTVTFKLEDQNYAVNILHVRDIVMGKPIYRIPNSDSILLGAVNLRGEIIPVYSLKAILGLPEPKLNDMATLLQSGEDEYLIIMNVEGRLFAIAVDRIHKNIAITPAIYNEGAYMNKWSKETIFIGVIMDGKDNILMMDIPQLLHRLTERNV